MGRSRRLVLGAALTVLLAACTSAEPDPSASAPSTASSRTGASETTSTTSVVPTAAAAMTAQFDERSGADIFVLLEREDASKAAGWNSPLGEPASLPGEAEAAVPDGRGGIVFVTDTQIWWISEPSAEPAVIEQPGIPVHLVGLRYIDGEPEVLVLIGQKLIGYDQGINELRGMFDQVGGDVIDIDVDGDHAVLVVESEPGRAVELVTMSTGAVAELVPPIVADDPAAPTLAAISGSNIVVMFDEQPGQVFTTNGTNRGEVNLRIEDMGVSSVDLAGGQLLAAFGEAAMVTDIETGERYVPSTPNGWVIGAVWGASPEPAPPDLVATDRYRVNTGMVEADTADPYLNVRMGPGAFHELLAKLPSTYTRLRWTGEAETSADGAVWYQVTLLDPIATTPSEPYEGHSPVGWVNSAFVEWLPEGLPVTMGEVPACVDDYRDIAATRGSRSATSVYALESAFLSDRCLRVVVTFGSGEMPSSWDTARDIVPADSIPEVLQGWDRFTLGGVDAVWLAAGQTGDGVYVVATGSGLELWMLQYPQRATLTALPERGILVVDLYLQDEPVSFPAVENVVLSSEPIAGSEVVVVTGIARTSQGQLGMRITDASGSLVSAVYSGSLATGTIETTKYAAQIPDSYPVWHQFAMQAEGLSPGDYTVFVDPGGGVAGFWRPLRLPISVDETDLTGSPDWRADFVGPPPLATDEEQDIVRSLMAFAGGGVPRSAVPFADQVSLGLNTVDFRARSRAELSDRGP